MTPLDWLTIALYFGLLTGLTWWSVLRNRNTADDYFLAGRDLGWVVVGASIFASNIGSEHLVGLAGAGATSGVALARYDDFYRKLRPHASQAQLVWIGRVATSVMVVIALAWIPVIQGARGLYEYLQGIQAYLAPPIAAVFLFGVFMKRLTAAGCLAALLTGFALGMIRLLVDTPVTLGMAGYEHGYAPGSWLWILSNIFFQYYGLLIFLVSVAVLIVVSYAPPPPADHQLKGLTYATVTSEQRRESRRSWNYWDVLKSADVLLLIATAYLYFNG
jgi:SSS family solute:Na+ symporter